MACPWIPSDSIDSSVNQIYPKDESAPKDFLFPHMPPEEAGQPHENFRLRHTDTGVTESGAVLVPAAQLGSVPGLSLLDAAIAPAAAATRISSSGCQMPTGLSECPCGESPVLPLVPPACRGAIWDPEPEGNRPRPRSPKGCRELSSTSRGSSRSRTTAPSAKRGAPSRSAWPLPTGQCGQQCPAPSGPCPAVAFRFALWEGVAHRMLGWARCRGRKADRPQEEKAQPRPAPDFRLRGKLLPRKPQNQKQKVHQPDSSAAV